MSARLRVGVDVSTVSFNNAGTARHSRELLRALQAGQFADVEIVPLSAGSARVTEPGWRRKLFVLYWELVYGPALLPRRARHLRLDLVHCTTPVPASAARWGRMRVLTTLHDIIPLTHPQWFPRLMGWRLRRWLRIAVGASRQLVASSRYTAGELHSRLGVPAERITVIYPGLTRAPAALPPPGVDRPYLLAVGTLEPRKNLAAALRAYRRLKDTWAATPPLQVVGGRGWGGVTVEAWAAQLGLAASVRALGFVPDDRLFALYANAEALVYPSLHEGFGFPPLEAMACGCPVVASRAASLPEVVGSAGLLVDPHDPEAIAESLRRVLADPALAQQLRAAGPVQAASFAWERCARETVALYREMLA